MRQRENIGLVFGTRPEIIKLSPIIRLLERQNRKYFLLHTGQHYFYAMDKIFFKELKLPAPKYRLTVHLNPADGHGEHTGRMLKAVEGILRREKPSVVLVQGDTNSVLAASLVAAKLQGTKLGHVEAGLRSYDRQMPEETNRVVSDHVSDFLFAPTVLSKNILIGEGISYKKIFVTGNTIVDAVRQNLEIAVRKRALLPYGIRKNSRFFLMTLHRQENVDDKKRLSLIFEGLRRIAVYFKTPIYFSAHPRTVKMIKKFRLGMPQGVFVVPPAGFLDFLRLEAAATLILTDSGGVQEEACILKIPCVTLRTSTERPETVKAGANVVSGYQPGPVLLGVQKMIRKTRDWKNPFGDGHAAKRILNIIRR